MNRARWEPVIAVVILLCGLGWYVYRNLKVTNEITSFLPEGKDRVVSVIARELAESELARSMIQKRPPVQSNRDRLHLLA